MQRTEIRLYNETTDLEVKRARLRSGREVFPSTGFIKSIELCRKRRRLALYSLLSDSKQTEDVENFVHTSNRSLSLGFDVSFRES